MSKKTAQEIETERQRSAMIARGADHNEIHNPNQVAKFNATGKVQHERQATGGGGKSGCLVLLALLPPGLTLLGVLITRVS